MSRLKRFINHYHFNLSASSICGRGGSGISIRNHIQQVLSKSEGWETSQFIVQARRVGIGHGYKEFPKFLRKI